MSVSEKVAYLRGLMEGLGLDEDSKETKLFSAVVDTLDEIASQLSDFDEDFEDLNDYMTEIDEDLGDLEGIVYGEDDCCCDDDCDCDCDCDCIEFHCPSCNEDVCIDLDCVDEQGICQCPSCGADIEFEILDEEDPDEE